MLVPGYIGLEKLYLPQAMSRRNGKENWVKSHFHNLTQLSWLAEATKPVTFDTANEEISLSCAGSVIVLFSVMFQSSRD